MSSVFPVLIVLRFSQTSCRVGQVTSRNYVYHFMEDVTAISIAYSHGSPSRLQIVQRGHEALLLVLRIKIWCRSQGCVEASRPVCSRFGR